MAESYSTLQRHSSYNPYPGCVFLQLTIETSNVSQGEFILDLNCSFNEQEKSLLNGQIKFGTILKKKSGLFFYPYKKRTRKGSFHRSAAWTKYF